MPRIIAYGLHAVELPFRGKFEHAATARETSSSRRSSSVVSGAGATVRISV